jgi:hypothetical protein
MSKDECECFLQPNSDESSHLVYKGQNPLKLLYTLNTIQKKMTAELYAPVLMHYPTLATLSNLITKKYPSNHEKIEG